MIMIIGGIRWNISVYDLQNWYHKHIKRMFQQLLNFLFIWLSGIHHERHTCTALSLQQWLSNINFCEMPMELWY